MRSCTTRSRLIAVKRPSAPPFDACISAANPRRDLSHVAARDVVDDDDAGLRGVIERRAMRAARGLAARWRSPLAASARLQASVGSASPSVSVAEVTTMPCAGWATWCTKGYRDRPSCD